MQAKKHPKAKRNRGRPGTFALTERELARNRKRRQRAKLAKNSLSKVEFLLPDALKKKIHKAAGKRSLSAIGLEAFRLWVEKNSTT
jgi:hypothetical protein